MNKLRDLVLDTLQLAGYDLLTACELWANFKKEIETMLPGKHAVNIGSTRIEFTKK